MKKVALSLLLISTLSFADKDTTPAEALETSYRALAKQSLLRKIMLIQPQIGKVQQHHSYLRGEKQSKANNDWTMVHRDSNRAYRWHHQAVIEHSDALVKAGILGKTTGKVTITEVDPNELDNPAAGYRIPLDIAISSTLKKDKYGIKSTQTITLKPEEIIGLTYPGFTLIRDEETAAGQQFTAIKETLKSQALTYDDYEGGVLNIAPFELITTQDNQHWQIVINALKIAYSVKNIPFKTSIKNITLGYNTAENSNAKTAFSKQLGTSQLSIKDVAIDLDEVEAIKIKSLDIKQTIKPSGDRYSLNATLTISPDSDIFGLLTGRVGMLVDRAQLNIHVDNLSVETTKKIMMLPAQRNPEILKHYLRDLSESILLGFAFDNAKAEINFTLDSDIGQAKAHLTIKRDPAVTDEQLNLLLDEPGVPNELQTLFITGNRELEQALEESLQTQINLTTDPLISHVVGLSDLLSDFPFKPKIVDGKHVYHATLSKQRKIVNDIDITRE